MRRIDEFRIFYNHTIHPELARMERKRKRLLLLLGISSVAMITMITILLFFNAAILAFFLLLPFGFHISYLLYRIRQFKTTFKPNVVNLILDFIDDSVNYGTLKYDSEKQIDKKTFLASKLFKTKAPQFEGEDYIGGKIGELDFEMSELNVREYSKVRNRLNYVFKGVFLHATFHTPIQGKIAIWPREFKQYLTGTIKAFTLKGGEEVEEETLLPAFEKLFMAYATPYTNVTGVLSKDMQHLIVDYRLKTGKEIYVSFLEEKIYIAITEPKDMLEPFIFQSNVNFELVKEFFEDIYLLMSIVEDFDKTH